jgi:hypothetical protein
VRPLHSAAGETRRAHHCGLEPDVGAVLARIPGIETLLSPPPDQPLAQINLAALPFDAWLPGLSLPDWFGTDLSNVPAHGPYWSVDASRIAAWRSRLAAAGRPGAAKIGLVFQANPEGAGFSDKSMQLSDIAPLLALEGIDIVNLQYGAAGRTLAAAAPGIIDPGEAALPLDEYGAALAATDLLITVDAMAAHLSGALGAVSSSVIRRVWNRRKNQMDTGIETSATGARIVVGGAAGVQIKDCYSPATDARAVALDELALTGRRCQRTHQRPSYGLAVDGDRSGGVSVRCRRRPLLG